MMKTEAERIGAYVLDAGLDASIIPIERGDRFVVCITNPQWFIWSFADWSAFCKEAKKQRRRERKASTSHEQVGIDPEVSYHLAFA